MTRFARAKGSKSSNERLPLESTPWHIMKQQLEHIIEKEEGSETKAKSAKQLLKEKDDLYYASTLGNTSNDWAEFENSKNKINNVKNGKVKKIPKSENKKLNKAAKKSIAEDTSSVNNIKNDMQKKKLKQKSNNIITVDSHESNAKKEKTKIDNVTEHSAEVTNKLKKKNKLKRKNNDVSGDNTINQQKDHKRKKKNEDVKDTIEETKNKKEKQSTENLFEDKSNENKKTNGKLSKRQKRNQKTKGKEKNGQKQKEGNVNENASLFDATGNDWDTSVKFSETKNFNKSTDRNSARNNRQKFSNLEEKNLYRFGNNVPKKYQQKVAKVRDDRDHKRRKPNTESIKVTINGMDVEIIKYDGFPVKKDDAKRLTELRKEMVLKGIPKSDIDAAMKLERRKCEKALARIRRQVCFHCRKAGHILSECPELGKEEAGTGICFKCGSTEHTHFECKVNKADDYRYAKCFICREQGHIAKQCPDNPKGLYPDGGSCKICGDVTHLKKDCPDLVKEKEETAITLDTIRDTNLESLGNETHKSTQSETKTPKKIVKF